MIVLDARVFVAYLQGEDVRNEAAETLLAREIGHDFGFNPLTIAEVLVVPARDDRLDEIRLILQELEVQRIPFPADTACKLSHFRYQLGVAVPGCRGRPRCRRQVGPVR